MAKMFSVSASLGHSRPKSRAGSSRPAMPGPLNISHKSTVHAADRSYTALIFIWSKYKLYGAGNLISEIKASENAEEFEMKTLQLVS